MDNENIIEEEEEKNGDGYIGANMRNNAFLKSSDNSDEIKDDSIYFIDGYLKETTKGMKLFHIIPNGIKCFILNFSASILLIGYGKPRHFKMDSIKIQNVVRCASRLQHSLFVDIKGNVYGIGENSEYQLGLNHNEHVNMPQLIPIDANIIEVAVGTYHSVLLSVKGCIYTMGSNEYGQCTQGSENHIKSPIKPDFFHSMICVQIFAGGAHSGVRTSDDSVYLFGTNFTGQCGVGKDMKKVKIPQKLTLSPRSVACGLGHTLIISTNNKLYACGWNMWGQIGNDTRDNQFGFIKINLPHDVMGATCGNAHSLCILENGAAYSWGKGDCGQLGHGHDINDKFVPTQINVENIKFKKCVAGTDTSCLIDENDDLYCFGRNKYGQLCVGDKGYKNIPTKIEKRNVTDISMGAGYSFLLM